MNKSVDVSCGFLAVWFVSVMILVWLSNPLIEF